MSSAGFNRVGWTRIQDRCLQRFCRFAEEEQDELGEQSLRPRRTVEPSSDAGPAGADQRATFASPQVRLIDEDGVAARDQADEGGARVRLRQEPRPRRGGRRRPIRRSPGSWTTGSTGTSRSRRPSSRASTSPRFNVKEIKLRPKIGVHDYETKKGHVVRFLNQRAKVKVTIMFRGRETTHPERGRDLLMRLAEDVKEIGLVESPPLLDGRNMVMVLGPDEERRSRQRDAKAEETQRSEEAVQGDRDGQAPAPAGDEEPQLSRRSPRSGSVASARTSRSPRPTCARSSRLLGRGGGR